MKNKVASLTATLNGSSFQTEEGVTFQVLDTQFFREKKIAYQHRDYLSGLRQGVLVSVTFHGHPVPLITVEGGVVRLKSIKFLGEEIKKSCNISELLRIKETRVPISLYSH